MVTSPYKRKILEGKKTVNNQSIQLEFNQLQIPLCNSFGVAASVTSPVLQDFVV
jgi:hypothetical protein